MKKLRITFATIVLLIAGNMVQAQSTGNIFSNIYNTWYEWPHETAKGNTVFKTTKYVPVPGIDKQDEPFGMLVIKSDGTFIKTQYCGFCPLVILEETKGSCVILSADDKINGISVKYEKEKAITPLKVISSDKDKLVITFPTKK